MGLKGGGSSQTSIIKGMPDLVLPTMPGVQGLSQLPGVPQAAPQPVAQAPTLNPSYGMTNNQQSPNGMQGLMQLLGQFQSR